jgi:hypothetical protein
MRELFETPILALFDGWPKNGPPTLPIQLFESRMTPEAVLQFLPLDHQLNTSDSERIAVEQVCADCQ